MKFKNNSQQDRVFEKQFLKDLHNFTDKTLKENVSGLPERMQSVLSMVYTLMIEGKTLELDELLQSKFPEYYSNHEKLTS